MTCNATSTTVPEGFDGHTGLLARVVSRLNYDDLPRDVVELAKICVLDALGSVFLGSTLPWGKIMTEYVKSVAGKPESIVVGGNVKVAYASLLRNDGDAMNNERSACALHHPGVVVVPAALAVAEREKSTGKEFITAVVAGYEVMNRVGMAVGTESHVMRGFLPTGTNGPYGAAAAAGKLLHLTEEQMIDALGIAGHQSSGLFEGVKEGKMTGKRFAGGDVRAGHAAHGVELGFTGPSTVLEGEWGYLRVFSDQADPSQLTERLGERYTIMETTFKPYPCCKALHAAIDGMLALHSVHRFDPDQVAEVVVGGYEKLVKMHDIYEPATSMAAQFSIPYVVSVASSKASRKWRISKQKIYGTTRSCGSHER